MCDKLRELSEKYDDDFCTVYLNGLYQTNDTIARRQLTRQLGIQIRQDVSINEKLGFCIIFVINLYTM